MNKRVNNILLIIFSVLFIVSMVNIVGYQVKSHLEQEEFIRLAEMIQTVEQDTRNGEDTTVYQTLKKENSDLFGWISIDGTNLSYPVMHTPDDEEYYLRRGFNKNYSSSGVPFLAAHCYQDCGNYLIYGHNMKNGTMFATLLSYADNNYYNLHPIIQFDTLTQEGKYQVISAFYTQEISEDNSISFNYHQYTELTDEATYQMYVNEVKGLALYDTGVSANFGEQLLTLSTCSYHEDEGRFVVVAKKIN